MRMWGVANERKTNFFGVYFTLANHIHKEIYMGWILTLQVIVIIVVVALVYILIKRITQRAPDEKTSNKKKFIRTLASSVLLAFLLAQPHAGFMIYLFTLPLLIWLIYSIYVVFTKPDDRKWQLARMAVWIVSSMVILVVHNELKQTTRLYADDTVAAINKYKLEHGAYPDNIEMIGMNKKQLEEKLGRPSGYYYLKGKPDLYYADTFIVFQTHHYDFQKSTWVYHGD